MLDRIAQAQHTIDEACGRLDRQITIMEICGTHTVAIFRSGIRSILPEKVKLLSGPGCPVCVTDQGYIDAVMQLADRDDCLIATYGDMIRVPGSNGSLETRASRGNVRVVLSSEDALQLARENPDKTVVFIAVGFETTTPATAVVVKEAAAEGIENFCVLSGHKLVLPAMRALLGGMNDRVDGFLCPGHVSVIIGSGAFAEVVENYHRPCVVAGFEPVQIIEALAEICRQLAAGKAELKSLYSAVVTERGNVAAQRIIEECFEPVDGYWRGLGKIAKSTLALREQYGRFDAFRRFGMEDTPGKDNSGCRCGEVLCGLIEPIECPSRDAMHSAKAHWSVHGQLGGDLLGVVQVRSKEMTREMTADPERILLAHGGGGQLMAQLIRERILPKFSNETLSELADAAHLTLPSGDICFTTDSYVVKPLFFRGGDIGKLSVCGTVNDLAVSGAKPLFLSLALIIEEGFELSLLERILQSISEAARHNGVSVVTGDTKTVERGSADGIFINTAGIGVRLPNVELGLNKVQIGDKILVSGTIADHGMTIVSQREGIRFESQLESDCAGLAELTCSLFASVAGIRFMRDPTRGGLAATLNEIVEGSRLSVEIREREIPVRPEVQAAADMLGFDVLNAANEGKFVAVVSSETADECLRICRSHALGTNARIIGEIVETRDVPLVELRTKIGGRRIVQMPYGRELPRIC